MNQRAVITLHRDALRFSAGHLMLLSENQRETLHGHDYQVSVSLTTDPGQNGFALDLRQYRDTLQTLCSQLDYHFLVPAHSAFLILRETDTHWEIQQQELAILLPREDVIILPVKNITLEELAGWFLTQLTTDPVCLSQTGILGIQVTVSNGRSESGSVSWDCLGQ